MRSLFKSALRQVWYSILLLTVATFAVAQTNPTKITAAAIIAALGYTPANAANIAAGANNNFAIYTGTNTIGPSTNIQAAGNSIALGAASNQGALNLKSGDAGGLGSVVLQPDNSTNTGLRFVSIPSGGNDTLVTLTATQTQTNKRITMRIGTTTTGSTITPTGDTADQYNVTALASSTTFAVPSGTPMDGQQLVLRIKSDATGGYTLTWTTTSGGYRIVGTTLPTTIVASKTIYVGCIYNAADAFWDVVAVDTQL